MKRFTERLGSTAAFSLVEVALALGVAGFCLVSVVSLLPVGVDSSRSAVDQTAASSIITHVLADLRATPVTSPPGGAATSAQYGIAIPVNTIGSTTPSKTLYFGNSSQQFSYSSNSSSQGTPRFRLTVNFLPGPAASDLPSPPASSPLTTATKVSLIVSWPAAVDPSTGTPAGRVQAFAALDRN